MIIFIIFELVGEADFMTQIYPISV